MPEPDDFKPAAPLPSLESLQGKIDSARSHTGIEKQGESSADSSKGIGDAMRIGIELVSGVAVGGVAGFFLDRWLHTLPLFFIIGFFLGAAAGFRNMIREAGKNSD